MAEPVRRPEVPRNLKPYFLCLLRKGARWNDPQGSEELLSRQLAFLREQLESGRFRIAGPLTDDGEIVGISIIEAPTLEAAAALANQDPGVQAQRLTAEVHPAFLTSLDAVRTEY
jgi:uncharacterized protein YciI